MAIPSGAGLRVAVLLLLLVSISYGFEKSQCDFPDSLKHSPLTVVYGKLLSSYSGHGVHTQDYCVPIARSALSLYEDWSIVVGITMDKICEVANSDSPKYYAQGLCSLVSLLVYDGGEFKRLLVEEDLSCSTSWFILRKQLDRTSPLSTTLDIVEEEEGNIPVRMRLQVQSPLHPHNLTFLVQRPGEYAMSEVGKVSCADLSTDGSYFGEYDEVVDVDVQVSPIDDDSAWVFLDAGEAPPVISHHTPVDGDTHGSDEDEKVGESDGSLSTEKEMDETEGNEGNTTDVHEGPIDMDWSFPEGSSTDTVADTESPNPLTPSDFVTIAPTPTLNPSSPGSQGPFEISPVTIVLCSILMSLTFICTCCILFVYKLRSNRLKRMDEVEMSRMDLDIVSDFSAPEGWAVEHPPSSVPRFAELNPVRLKNPLSRFFNMDIAMLPSVLASSRKPEEMLTTSLSSSEFEEDDLDGDGVAGRNSSTWNVTGWERYRPVVSGNSQSQQPLSSLEKDVS
mgnify:CR=1 FL=1